MSKREPPMGVSKYSFLLDHDEECTCINLMVMTEDCGPIDPYAYADALVEFASQIKMGFKESLFAAMDPDMPN